MPKFLYSSEHKKIAMRLRLAREQAGLGQDDAAKMLKRSQSYISKVESGQRRLDIVEIKHFARIYKKDLSFFINDG